ncbi:MAG: BTAD domain-containing putative transcriptional regulator, partial [Anaerolineae bacterium]
MPPYNIRLFGAIEVFQNGQLVTSFRSQKTLVILAYLLSQNRLLTRAHLAGLFWPDVPQTQALGHLRRALHNLSKNLSGCLDTTRRTATFHPNASVVVDIFQFQALVKQNSINSMAEAVALYRAPFLEGIFDPNSPELEQWMERERERWLQETIRLMQKLVDETQRKGQYDLALSYAQKLAAMAPWQEKNHYRLMQLYFKTGQPQAALSHFETCRKLLAAELEISPSPDITALYDRIRKATAVRHNLPPDPTPFIGRQKELAALHSMVANPDCRLITLVGAGGMGKTRLALELARQSVNHFLEGVRIVNLTDVVTTEGLLSTLKAVFGLPAAPGGDESAQLLNYLRDKEMLLALDNFEQLADTPDLSAAILREAAAVQLLVTSRRPLNLQEEWLFDLDGLPWPQPGETADWLTYEAPQLFGEAARRRCPRFDLKTNIAAVIKICRLVQGSPLALEMAAAACRDMPCAAIAEGIVQNLDILQTPLRNVPERHRSVQAVFNNAWVHLDEIAQTAYARLSIFRSSFATAAAAEVTGVTPQQIS